MIFGPTRNISFSYNEPPKMAVVSHFNIKGEKERVKLFLFNDMLN